MNTYLFSALLVLVLFGPMIWEALLRASFGCSIEHIGLRLSGWILAEEISLDAVLIRQNPILGAPGSPLYLFRGTVNSEIWIHYADKSYPTGARRVYLLRKGERLLIDQINGLPGNSGPKSVTFPHEQVKNPGRRSPQCPD